MNELISYEAVYRTDPATPGLLKFLMKGVRIEEHTYGHHDLQTNSAKWAELVKTWS